MKGWAPAVRFENARSHHDGNWRRRQSTDQAVAISPPSDIVFDVIRAADPAAVREAQHALASHSAKAYGANAAKSAADAFDRSFGAARLVVSDPGGAAGGSDGDRALFDSYQKFEAMVLQTFVAAMLPQKENGYFGEGTAGEIWKGMMAEQLGAMIVEGGGVGIAESLMPDDSKFGADDRLIHPGMAGESRGLPTNLLHELQRATLDSWNGHDDDDDDDTTESGLWS